MPLEIKGWQCLAGFHKADKPLLPAQSRYLGVVPLTPNTGDTAHTLTKIRPTDTWSHSNIQGRFPPHLLENTEYFYNLGGVNGHEPAHGGFVGEVMLTAAIYGHFRQGAKISAIKKDRFTLTALRIFTRLLYQNKVKPPNNVSVPNK
ncbi:hypothetical protein H5410_023265 [Solanum commersonii]|uniref:Uncharacterized protein n=1 Tax=Solanum commersonii TaxID=4109 RepID=A0A9J5ZJ13_SOLCO|nr:hypothetical protein H5410_023265 [Solanum commersonii]